MKTRSTLLVLMMFLFVFGTSPIQAQKANACDLQSSMRKLWEDHVQYTRYVIFNILDNLPGTTEQVNRLLQNQVDIGNAIKPYYGNAAGNQLTSLLHDHITIAADLLTALKNNSTAGVNTANAEWYANADAIAAFLASANPNWPLSEMQTMMHTHLALTTQEALARKNMDYAADVTAYDAVHNEILQMSDMLSEGIVKQFPNMFSGCPLTNSMKENKKPTTCDLRTAERKFWEDHITWTRNVIFNIIDGLPGTTQAVNRLLANQDDIGNSIKPYYGNAAGDHLAYLLRQHITIAADILIALKNNNTTALNTANAAWFVNADSIAKFLSTLNPEWTYTGMKQMMDTHLNLTTQEALARKTANYSADITAYDNVHAEILQMSDMLSQGIADQFKNQFSGCPLNTMNAKITGVLRQNIPNPFSNSTTISYILPETVKKARLQVFNSNGALIRSIDLDKRGEGMVNVSQGLLARGIYSYSLIADGQVVETKQMIMSH
jgi:hypothetical protein